ncbi:Protein TAPT1-like protein [Smittium culicis]|uniref:Protein TAPT1-like protein n=1 Tax=Smittium culicis TaxID=133412 RepID=A0A1R1XPR4_9FUNG|nr:Protein TAPT1-like protein [Smittium culicis]
MITFDASKNSTSTDNSKKTNNRTPISYERAANIDFVHKLMRSQDSIVDLDVVMPEKNVDISNNLSNFDLMKIDRETKIDNISSRNEATGLEKKKKQIDYDDTYRLSVVKTKKKIARASSNPLPNLDISELSSSIFDYKHRKRFSYNISQNSIEPITSSYLFSKKTKSKRISNVLTVSPLFSPSEGSNLDDSKSQKLSPLDSKLSNSSFGSPNSPTSMVIVLKDKSPTTQETSIEKAIREIYELAEKSEAELIRKRMFFFLNVPYEIEKLMALGVSICANAYLNTFIDLPIQALSVLYDEINTFFLKLLKKNKSPTSSFNKNNTPKADWNRAVRLTSLYKIFVFITTFILVGSVDSAQAYHTIRAQSSLKLYFIFNSLELFDKLLTSFGLDALDSIQYSIAKIIEYKKSGKSSAMDVMISIIHGIIGLVYMLLHTLVLYFQVLSLNVAINSYSQQLLLLLISNQFVELKGNILKKFEKENFFQLTCGDIVERFQEFVFLGLIITQNLFELIDSRSFGFNSTSVSHYFATMFSPEFLQLDFLLNRVLIPVFMVIGTEIIVDWVKHAFIAKFNWFRPYLYSKYGDILCRDLVGATPADDIANMNNNTGVVLLSVPSKSTNGKKIEMPDLTPKVARRMGFLPYPLAVLTMVIVSDSIILVTGNITSFFSLLKCLKGLFSLFIMHPFFKLYQFSRCGLMCYIDSPKKDFKSAFICNNFCYTNKIQKPDLHYLINTLDKAKLSDQELKTFYSNKLAILNSYSEASSSSLSNHYLKVYENEIDINSLQSTCYYILFVSAILVLVAVLKFFAFEKLKQYASSRYLSFCKNKAKPQPDNIQNSKNGPQKSLKQDCLQNSEESQKTSKNPTSKSTNLLGVDKKLPTDSSSTEIQTTTIQRKVSITGFHDLTKELDLQRLEDVKNLISSDADEVAWDKMKPKWNLDNVSRYSLFKSRIP